MNDHRNIDDLKHEIRELESALASIDASSAHTAELAALDSICNLLADRRARLASCQAG